MIYCVDNDKNIFCLPDLVLLGAKMSPLLKRQLKKTWKLFVDEKPNGSICLIIGTSTCLKNTKKSDTDVAKVV